MSQIRFLGTGTSTGIPEIGCHCHTCSSTDPRDHRFRSSALLEYGGETILLDCGPDVRQQLLRAKTDRLDRILITHEHYDHTGGLDDIRPLFWKTPSCPIHAEPNVLEALHRRMPYAFGEHRYLGLPQLVTSPVFPHEEIQTASGAPILPLRVMHGKLPIVGYRFGDLAWVTDCKTLPPETIEALRGIPHLVINALRLYEHPAHMCFEETMQILEEIQPQQAYLIHFAHTIGRHTEVEALCPEGVEPAYDGLTIDF